MIGGESATALVRQAKREQALAHLPPYKTEMVDVVKQEICELQKQAAAMLESLPTPFDPSADPATACALLVNHSTMRWDKRCLMAYHQNRTSKIEAMCRKGLDVRDMQQQQQRQGQHASDVENSSILSPEEEEYARQYTDMLAADSGQWPDIDLTGSMKPPRDLFIDVRVLKDAGEIQTEYGSINLTKNSQFYARQSDVERLIQQGYLQRLD